MSKIDTVPAEDLPEMQDIIQDKFKAELKEKPLFISSVAAKNTNILKRQLFNLTATYDAELDE